MSEQDEYMPTTDEVRHAYRDTSDFLAQVQRVERPTDEESDAAFDRWLAENDAQVAARALREAALAMRHSRAGSWNLPDPEDPGVSYSVDRWVEVRADRIERQEGDL